MNMQLNWQARASYTLLDTAFGVGQQFLARWASWVADPDRPKRLHYVAIAPTPATVAQILENTENPGLARELASEWWGLVPGIHRLRLAAGHVTLTLAIGELHPVLKSLVCDADAVFFNDTAPGVNQDLLDTLKALTRHCRVGGLFVSPNPNPVMNEQLRSLGYQIEDSQTSLRARFAPHWPMKRQAARPVNPDRAIVIGAGLSGAAVAWQLAEHGWQVEVMDRADQPAANASALPVGLMATHVSPDDAPLSRASRTGIRTTLAVLKALCIEGEDWRRTGALEQGRDPVKSSWPAHWAKSDAADWFSRDADGLHHKTAAWIKPGALVRAWLHHPGIQFKGGTDVHSLTHTGQGWLLQGMQQGVHGQTLGKAPMVVVCTAFGLRRLLPGADALPLDLVAGQVAMAPQKTSLNTPLNGNGHWVPNVPGFSGPFWLSGSTYERLPLDELDAAKGLESNRMRLARLLANWPQACADVQNQFDQGQVHRWLGERCTSIDRLPLVGEWLPGLHVSAAQGSRGLCFAALCAELLVAHLTAEPLPVDARLAQGFAAQRFHKAS